MKQGLYLRGAACGIGSAVLFGVSAPAAKLLLPETSPWLLAGLLYLGAGVGLSVISWVSSAGRSLSRIDRIQRKDVPLLAGIILAGGVLGPILLLLGLSRVSGVVGSLLLNLEAVFTMMLAVCIFGERMTRLEAVGGLVVAAGAAVVSYRTGTWESDWFGALAIVGACLSWGLDNNLTNRLSARRPLSVVRIKTLTAGLGNVILAGLAGQRMSPARVPAALALGFVSYGVSIVLDFYALRYIGAAREAAFFATAPFAGSVAAVPILGERFTLRTAMSGVVMAIGMATIVFGRSRTSPQGDEV